MTPAGFPHKTCLVQVLQSLRGNPVKFRDGPAAVTGDKVHKMPLFLSEMGRVGRKDDPEVRRPACNIVCLPRQRDRHIAISGKRTGWSRIDCIIGLGYSIPDRDKKETDMKSAKTVHGYLFSFTPATKAAPGATPRGTDPAKKADTTVRHASPTNALRVFDPYPLAIRSH